MWVPFAEIITALTEGLEYLHITRFIFYTFFITNAI